MINGDLLRQQVPVFAVRMLYAFTSHLLPEQFRRQLFTDRVCRFFSLPAVRSTGERSSRIRRCFFADLQQIISRPSLRCNREGFRSPSHRGLCHPPPWRRLHHTMRALRKRFSPVFCKHHIVFDQGYVTARIRSIVCPGGNRMKHKDKWQPIVLMILTTLIAMGAFYWIKSWNNTRFLPVTDVAGEETDPPSDG